MLDTLIEQQVQLTLLKNSSGKDDKRRIDFEGAYDDITDPVTYAANLEK